jgi:rare lipoprotein A (peptidoglycan hydrolase)
MTRIREEKVFFRRRLWLAGAIFVLLFLTGCAGRLYKTEGGYKQGHQFFSSEAAKEQAAKGVGEVIMMNCSYYGEEYNGRKTSSGETYDMYGMTCAHKEMAFGTKLKVSNPDNGKSVTVTVNDRGPFKEGRDLDLSYGAAKEIGILHKGLMRLPVEILEKQ